MSNTINIRYIVDDVDEAIPFYEKLGFTVDMHPAPPFAAMSKDGVTLYLNQQGAGGGGSVTEDGTMPEPGGWNRLHMTVDDLDAWVEKLREEDIPFRDGIVEGNGGRRVLIEDPSSNLVEVFEPSDN